MIETQICFEVDGAVVSLADLADEYLVEMLAHTEAHIRQQLQRQLSGVRCAEHGAAPRVTVTASYAADVDQMELSYHVDACCPALLLRAVGALNR